MTSSKVSNNLKHDLKGKSKMSHTYFNGHAGSNNQQANPGTMSARVEEEVFYHLPSLPAHDPDSLETQTATMLEELKGLLPTVPLNTWQAIFDYRTLAVNASRQLEALKQQARQALAEANQRVEVERTSASADIADFETRLIPVEEALVSAQQQFSDAAGRSMIVCDPATVTPEAVASALERQLPSAEELAGANRVIPSGSEGQFTRLLWRNSWTEKLLAGVSGSMLAVNLGVVTNLLSLSDLQRPEGFPRLALAFVVGFVIVVCAGELVEHGSRSLARALEERPSKCPGLHARLLVAILLIALGTVVVGAEIATEAVGLRQLHEQQHRQERRLNQRTADTSLPLWTYALIGTLITCPFIFRKGAKAWGESELAQRQAWLAANRSEQLTARGKEPTTQRALALAYEISRLSRVKQRLETEIQKVTLRRDALQPKTEFDAESLRQIAEAEKAALGASATLRREIRELIAMHEPVWGPRTGAE